MNGNANDRVCPDANFDWNEAYTGQGEADYEAPDATFLEEIDSLTPGRALDLGCGAGGLAIELARRGWQVVAVDLAEKAITSARKNAAQRGVAVKFAVGDVSSWEPEGEFDLITSSFALPGASEARRRTFRLAMGALALGGTLLVAEWEGATVDFQTVDSDDFWTSRDEVLRAIEGLEIESAEITDAPVHDHSRGDAHTESEHVHDCGDEAAGFNQSDWKAFYVRARRAT
jgi:SAM-dependent methyltransferase